MISSLTCINGGLVNTTQGQQTQGLPKKEVQTNIQFATQGQQSQL